MRRVALSIALLVVATQTSGCGTMNHKPNCASTGAIVAGQGEPTFVERYSLNITLPMREEEFLAIVKKLALSYTTMSPNGELPMSKPRSCPELDLSGIDHGYLVHGGTDARTERTEDYMALVNRDGEVIYIENRYQYPPAIR